MVLFWPSYQKKSQPKHHTASETNTFFMNI